MTTRTIARRFAHCLARTLLTCLMLAVVVAFSLATAEKESTSRPAARGTAAALVEAHDCVGQDDPTHAVVTIDGQTRYVGRNLTNKAIEQAFFGVDHSLTIHAFCA